MKITPELADVIRATFPVKPRVHSNDEYVAARDREISEFKKRNPECQKLLEQYESLRKQIDSVSFDLNKKFGLYNSGYVANEDTFRKAGGRIILTGCKLCEGQVLEIISKLDDTEGIAFLRSQGINWRL